MKNSNMLDSARDKDSDNLPMYSVLKISCELRQFFG